MIRWNIKNVVLYNYSLEKEILEFNLTGVNIITGKSHKGKSALIEVIDYSLCSSKCNLPVLIKEACSWVGILLKKNEDEILILRKVPENGKSSDTNVYLEVGKNLEIPASFNKIKKNTNRESALLKLEEIFQIGSIKNNYFENEYKETKRISLRYYMSLLIQDDDIINNKNNLLRGLDSERKKDIIEAIPYFFGVIDEEFINNKEKYKKIKKKYEVLNKQKEKNEKLESENSKIADNLYCEAKQVGLVNEDETLAVEEVLEKLKNTENLLMETPLSENKKLIYRLRKEKTQIMEEISNLEFKNERFKEYTNLSKKFIEVNQKQKERLEVVDLFVGNEEKICICPLCDNQLLEINEKVSFINEKRLEIENQIKDTNNENPKIENHIAEINNELETLKTRKIELTEKIKVLVKENELEKDYRLEQRQGIVVGKIRFYYDILVESKEFDMKKLQLMEEELLHLEEKINESNIIEKLNNIKSNINTYAFEIMKTLPLEERYKGCPIDLDLNKLELGIINKNNKKDKMREIGSDQNHLCLHIAIMLAIHRHINNIEKPYLGFLIFDQISRPFFPPESSKNEIIFNEEEEKNELKKYFDCLFNESLENKSLQIIILEHAYFANDDKFKNATKYRWNEDGKALIPESWLENNSDGK